MSKLKSKIDFKPTTKDAYDAPRMPLSMMLMDEAGQWANPKLPKDFINFKKLATIDKDGNVKPLLFSKPKKKKK